MHSEIFPRPCLPISQLVHVVEPAFSWYYPAKHSMQLSFPVPAAKKPAMHDEQSVVPLKAAYFPPVHVEHKVEPVPLATRPAEQPVHTAALAAE
jgi:hypothetical protein